MIWYVSKGMSAVWVLCPSYDVEWIEYNTFYIQTKRSYLTYVIPYLVIRPVTPSVQCFSSTLLVILLCMQHVYTQLLFVTHIRRGCSYSHAVLVI